MGMARRARAIVAAEERARAQMQPLMDSLNDVRAALLGHDPLMGNAEVMARAMICRRGVHDGWSIEQTCLAMDLHAPVDLLNLLRAASITGAASIIEGWQATTVAGQRAAGSDVALADDAFNFPDRALGLD